MPATLAPKLRNNFARNTNHNGFDLWQQPAMMNMKRRLKSQQTTTIKQSLQCRLQLQLIHAKPKPTGRLSISKSNLVLYDFVELN